MSVAVFFFGGYQASQSDIDRWVRSARLQKPQVIFRGFPWPSGANAGLVAGDLSQGYFNCRTNLMFLNRFMELH
jgi:hypothetical protein